MYQVDLLSVLRGISKNLERAVLKAGTTEATESARVSAYVACAKDQLDEVIEGLTPNIKEFKKHIEAVDKTVAGDRYFGQSESDDIRRELLGEE